MESTPEQILASLLDEADAGPTRRRSHHPVDLRALDYVDSYDHNLMCAICHSPFVRPVTLECEHVFCQRCISETMFHQGQDLRTDSATCPSCRRKLHHPATTPVTKILNQILDELRVNCPFRSAGCREVKHRGQIQDHVDKYCDYVEVECPLETCLLPVQRKDIREPRCLHGLVKCEDCRMSFLEKELESHQKNHCEAGKVSCPDCKAQVSRRDLAIHAEICPEAVFPCGAAQYGCDFSAQLETLLDHETTCPLVKLVPFLKMQNERLVAHEAALKHLRQKNSILETSFSTIQETLNPSNNNLIDLPSSSTTGSDTGPFDSTAHHLLSLHESLREEVNRVSAAVEHLDAKASMMIMNANLTIKEDLSHTNAAIAGMRMQLHWLVSARLQNQQRVGVVGTQRSGERLGSTSGNNTAGPSGSVELPVRRLSDSNRQDPKL
ncbi:hypothetical protein JMJ35_005501 [Cladonia borealis]|uniref:Uncharacterized protein n=1 Tax=Cladonia borealis TaxID=184061 RepID=A0AA39R029_9LECA|nr:hypothetical protein JMJ35_005501 [Cladonia borealis]